MNEKKMEKSEECGSSVMWRKSRTKRGPASIPHAVRWKKASTARCADPSSGHMTKKKEGISRPGFRSKYWASEDRRHELCVIREAVRDEVSQNTLRSARRVE